MRVSDGGENRLPYAFFNLVGSFYIIIRSDYVKSILEAFAYGEINPIEDFLKWDSQYGRVVESISEYEEKLLSMLDGDASELLMKFSLAQAEAGERAGVGRFICGYRLGVLMTMEVLMGKERGEFGGEESV